jgi:hypothetical protein
VVAENGGSDAVTESGDSICRRGRPDAVRRGRRNALFDDIPVRRDSRSPRSTAIRARGGRGKSRFVDLRGVKYLIKTETCDIYFYLTRLNVPPA